MTVAGSEPRRKSPEVRREPLRQIVLPVPLPVPDEYADQFTRSVPGSSESDLEKRKTPLVGAMVRRVPFDGRWYLVAIAFSSGQATAMASHISRGGYGIGVSVRRGPMPNENRANVGREPW